MEDRPYLHIRKSKKQPDDKLGTTAKLILASSGTGIILLGVIAWVAGYAYLMGYWGEAGFEVPAKDISVQVMMFNGFVFALNNWMWTSAILFFSALVYAIIAILIGTFKDEIRQAFPTPTIVKKIKAEKSLLYTGIALGTASAVMFILAIFFTIWILVALRVGEKTLLHDVCRTTPPKPTITLEVAPGKVVSGNLLDQINDWAIIQNGNQIVLLRIGDNPKIIGINTFTKNECHKNSFPIK